MSYGFASVTAAKAAAAAKLRDDNLYVIVDNGVSRVYVYDADSATAESLPNVISVTAGGRFLLAPAPTDANVLGGAVPGKVATQLNGANWSTLPSAAAVLVQIQNLTGVDIEWRLATGGESNTIVNNSYKQIPVSANANELQVRRVDLAGVEVDVEFETYNFR